MGRFFIHDEPIDFGTLEFIVLHGLFCYFAHLVMTLFGKYFVHSEVLRMGNDSILDGLEEGVIIKDELTDEIIYINKAA